MAEMVSKIQKERPSASADATLRAEVERVTAMTVEERIREALSMGSQFPFFS
jgi:hypothetical protein